MKLETEVGGMLALLIEIEDINLSSRRKTVAQTYSLFSKSLCGQLPKFCVKAVSFDEFIYSSFLTVNSARIFFPPLFHA